MRYGPGKQCGVLKLRVRFPPTPTSLTLLGLIGAVSVLSLLIAANY